MREEKKLSQGDIEERTGLLRCYISRVENGHTVPAIETLEKLTRALEVPLYQLFYDGEAPPALPNLPPRKTSDDIAWGGSGKGARLLNTCADSLAEWIRAPDNYFSSWLKKWRATEPVGQMTGSNVEHRGRIKFMESGRRSVAGFANEAYNLYRGKVIRKDIYPYFYGAARGEKMDLRCPSCNGTDLKKLSLAYQQGRVRVDTRTRLRGVVVGEGGPDVVVGRATTRGTHQTELSEQLSPPAKWSYLKLIGWSVVFSLVALVAYVRSVMSGPSPASSLPVKLYALFFPIVLVVLLALYWRHNHSTYSRQYTQWDRSFVCERCGNVSEHDLSGTSSSWSDFFLVAKASPKTSLRSEEAIDLAKPLLR